MNDHPACNADYGGREGQEEQVKQEQEEQEGSRRMACRQHPSEALIYHPEVVVAAAVHALTLQ